MVNSILYLLKFTKKKKVIIIYMQMDVMIQEICEFTYFPLNTQ